MLFNSAIFIFLFLPLVLCGWYGLHAWKQEVLANLFLLGMSLWFYGYCNSRYLLIIICSIAVNYCLSFFLDYFERKNTRKFFLILGVGFNLGLLFYFKYYDFFLDNLNIIFKCDFTLKNIVLPLGISFFTFQQLSFVVDRYYYRAPHYSLLPYANFVTFFPQLIAGPIVLHEELVPQLAAPENHKPRVENFVPGIEQFVMGLGKKVLLADPLAYVVNYGFDKVFYLDSLSAILTMVTYAFELYFDFSGYCDMAIGIGKMFGVKLPQNFNSPYKAENMQQLWRGWHMTLTRFFTTYVYYPLGGNRKGKIRTNINLFIIFLLSGFWHGAAWTYVLWGISQGIAIVWCRERREKKKEGQALKLQFSPYINRCLTFGYFVWSLILFRSVSVQSAVLMMKRIFAPTWNGFLLELVGSLQVAELYVPLQLAELKLPGVIPYIYLGYYLFLMVISIRVLCEKNAEQIILEKRRGKGHIWMLASVAMFSIISLSQASTFLYFTF